MADIETKDHGAQARHWSDVYGLLAFVNLHVGGDFSPT